MKIYKKILSIVIALIFIALTIVSAFAQDITVDNNFSDNTVLVVLTQEESKKDAVLTPDDFNGLGVIEVERLSYDGAIQHVYSLELDKHDKDNVLDVISELKKIEWIYSAEPNYSFSPEENKPEVTDALLKAIKSYHNIDVNKEDIYLEYMCRFEEHKYLVRYKIRGVMYPCDIVKIQLGEYLLTTPRPVPMVYKDGNLYDFEDAYVKGYLSEFDMYGLTSFKSIDIKIVDNKIGDADMDGELSILDATHIQMHIAGLLDESAVDLNLSDIDADGEISILDATAIQLKLAQID